MKKRYIALLILLPFVLALVSLSLGRYGVDIGQVVKILLSQIFPIEPTWSEMEETVVMQIRLPRIILAILIGGGLAIAGASFQGMFGNPLVSPDILGVSAGAGFGASLGILLMGNGFGAQMTALVFGVLAIAVTYIISGVQKKCSDFYACISWGCYICIIPSAHFTNKVCCGPRRKITGNYLLADGEPWFSYLSRSLYWWTFNSDGDAYFISFKMAN